MQRFITISTLTLLSLVGPALAAPKPKPPAISACYHQLCLNQLRWRRADMFSNTTSPSVQGTFFNGNPTVMIEGVVLKFALKAGNDLIGTGLTLYTGAIPPGGSWSFIAEFSSPIGERSVTRIETVVMDIDFRQNGQRGRDSQTLSFDPLFNPDNSNSGRKEWEKIHGPRQR